MKRILVRGAFFAQLATLALGTTLLAGCWKKEHDDDDECPKGAVCNTAAAVVDMSGTGGCGLALRLENGTILAPAGRAWNDFHAKAGDKLLLGYYTPSKKDDDDHCTCTAYPQAKVGCVSLNPDPNAK